MKITSLDIISFGKFKNKKIELTDGLNILCGNNESGKSTIISFIYAMLYGFGDNRGKVASLREKYTPWDGGVCEGKITLKRSNNENITIYRKAGSVKKNDIVKIYNEDTGEEYSLSPEDLTGVGSDTFMKTLCIKQLSTAFSGTNEEIVQKLSNISSGGDETVSFEKAIKILENARREIKPLRGNGGSLFNVTSEIAQLEKDNALKKALLSQLDDTLSLLPKAESLFKEAEIKLLQEIKEDFISPIAHIRGRIEEKELSIKNRPKKKKSSPKKALLGSGGILLLLSLVLFAFFPVFSLVFVALSVFSFIMAFRAKEIDEEPYEENEIIELSKELSNLLEKKARHDEKIELLKRNKDDCEKNLSELKIRKDSLSAQLSSIKSADLTSLYEKKRALEKNLSSLNTAIDALTSAHENMQRNFTPLLNKKASEYFSFITSGKYARIFSDEQFNLSIDLDIPRKSELFSGGTIDQLYLSLRLALIDMLFGDEETFILLDQPFLQYDSIRLNEAVRLLESLSDNRQILIFTSNKDTFSSNKLTQMLT